MLPSNTVRHDTPTGGQSTQEASSSLSPLLEVPDPSPSPSPSPSPTAFRRSSQPGAQGNKGQRSALGIASGRPLIQPMTSTVTSASGAGATAAADALATPTHHPRRVSSVRPSFSTFREPHRRSRAPSRVSSRHLGLDDEDIKLPSLVPGIRPAYSTPLPVLPMIVLCIVSWICGQGFLRA